MMQPMISRIFGTRAATAAARFSALLGGAAEGELTIEPTIEPSLAAPRTCLISVRQGLHAGASVRLRAPVCIGSAPESDLVLRDVGVSAQHALLSAQGGRWRLVAHDTKMDLPAIAVSRRGRYLREHYEFGGASVCLSQAMPVAPVRAAPAASPLSQRIAFLGAPILIAVSLTLGTAGILHFAGPAAARAAPSELSLSEAGWPDAMLIIDARGERRVEGFVDDDAAMQRLDAWLRIQGHVRVNNQARIGAQLAANVREAVADTGIGVRYAKGRIHLSGTTEDLAVRSRLQSLRSDLAGTVEIVDEVAYVAVRRQSVSHVLPIRIVSVAPGELASFVADNGSRYFIGATLSDGSEVVAILPDAVIFRNGSDTIAYALK